jgi:hypothetical protein
MLGLKTCSEGGDTQADLGILVPNDTISSTAICKQSKQSGAAPQQRLRQEIGGCGKMSPKTLMPDWRTLVDFFLSVKEIWRLSFDKRSKIESVAFAFCLFNSGANNRIIN